MGEVIPLRSPSRALVEEGTVPRWHALIVAPQSEGRTRAWLDQRGVYSFYPVLELTRWRMGRSFGYERRFIPGYVFARFPGRPLWHRMWDVHFIRDVIRRADGEPGWLAEATLEALLAMRSAAEQLEDKRRRARTIRKGDRVRIRDGALAGSEVEITEVRTTTGVFRIAMLGGDQDVEMDLDRMEKFG